MRLYALFIVAYLGLASLALSCVLGVADASEPEQPLSLQLPGYCTFFSDPEGNVWALCTGTKEAVEKLLQETGPESGTAPQPTLLLVGGDEV